jgi:hypothetical protein
MTFDKGNVGGRKIALLRSYMHTTYISTFLKIVTKLIIYLFRSNMEWGGRSISLMNLTCHGEGSSSSIGEGSSGNTSSVPMASQRDNDIGTGVDDILAHGSPMCGTSCDPSILDDDSNSDGGQPAISKNIGICESEKMCIDMSGGSRTDDPLYHQCRNARQSGFKDKLVSVTVNDSFGSTVMSPSAPIGSLCDRVGLENTFHGSRLHMGNTPVNQSISSSFDPSRLVCVSCKMEHKIVFTKPLTILFSDQNFVSSLEADKGECLNIVRMEDASLSDLVTMAREIF